MVGWTSTACVVLNFSELDFVFVVSIDSNLKPKRLELGFRVFNDEPLSRDPEFYCSNGRGRWGSVFGRGLAEKKCPKKQKKFRVFFSLSNLSPFHTHQEESDKRKPKKKTNILQFRPVSRSSRPCQPRAASLPERPNETRQRKKKKLPKRKETAILATVFFCDPAAGTAACDSNDVAISLNPRRHKEIKEKRAPRVWKNKTKNETKPTKRTP